jgi:hypothetical protein
LEQNGRDQELTFFFQKPSFWPAFTSFICHMADSDAPAAAAATATPLVAALPAATAQQSAAATSNTGVKANNDTVILVG